MLSDFFISLLVTQAVILSVFGLYCYIQDAYKHKLNRKFWIYVQENKFNDVIQQEWELEMKDQELADFERLVDNQEVQIWE